MELLVNEDFFKLYYVADGHYLKSIWVGFPPSDGFRNAFESILKSVIEKKTTRVLIDGRESRMATTEDQVWLATDFLPRAAPQGYKHVAVIYPHDVVGQLTSQRAVQNIQEETDKQDLPYYMEIFSDEDEALAWLIKQN